MSLFFSPKQKWQNHVSIQTLPTCVYGCLHLLGLILLVFSLHSTLLSGNKSNNTQRDSGQPPQNAGFLGHFGIIQNTISSEQWPGCCLLLCIQCCLIAMEDLSKAGSTVCLSSTEYTGWWQLVSWEPVRAPWPPPCPGVVGLASPSSELESICKRLSFLV